MSLLRRLVAWIQSLSKKQKPGLVLIAFTSRSIAPGQTVQGRSIVFDRKGDPMPNTSPSSWVSDNTSVATVDNTGLVTAVAPGTCGITAILDKLTSNVVAITVTPPVPASIVVTPNAVSLVVGHTTQLTAAVLDSSGQPI